ncbi:uncharacterized protein LOC129913051 isoform X3 [Episyrphus balteatus]|uniref:uncharacterized protein LOC129913051 isoform X3 n=1 Tax=Episyrphus balteatus TaxID=286459 RepID=UPI00248651B3|nr:uncharacterized protein LOC129913051 isoform X3 [Episyrphus balteatus]
MRFCLVFFITCTFFTSIFNWKLVESESDGKIRGKRYLDFIKSSRMFFRINIKYNVFNWTNIWTHGVGFKANMNILNDRKPLRPFRRDTYEVLHQLLDLHGFDGKACLLKAFCVASREANEGFLNGVLYKLLRYIFELNEHDRRHFKYLKDENCDQILHHHCPLSFNSISPFTDDV